MSGPPRPPVAGVPGIARPDYARLAEVLKALAYPTRLELLDQLRMPRTLGEIDVSPTRTTSDANPDRSISRPAVLAHLQRLMETGLVRSEPVKKGGRDVPRYEVAPSRLYALMEELRRLSVTFAGRTPASEQTGTMAAEGPPRPVEGPRLMLVHGVYEGKHFPLSGPAADDGWVIGRAATAEVCLDYDPYVSAENARVVRDAEGFTLTDLGAKNGTSVNWEPLEPGESRPLGPGDLIGVGWSRLSFIPG